MKMRSDYIGREITRGFKPAVWNGEIRYTRRAGFCKENMT